MTASPTPPTSQETRQRLVALRVRQFRAKLGLTQAAAAASAGLPLRTYRRFEASGRGNVETLYAIAVAFGRGQMIEGVFTIWGDRVGPGSEARASQTPLRAAGPG